MADFVSLSLHTADGHFRLSVSQLPAWAKRHVQARPSIAQSFSTSSLEKAGVEGGRDEGGGVEGRWAEVGLLSYSLFQWNVCCVCKITEGG